ncbi:MAG: recombinase family protein [Candidatus Izemoplasma sp.]|nr:recombinase family protein [Candidatus Izemoplasma sp.]
MNTYVEIIEPTIRFKDEKTNEITIQKKVAAYARVSTDETDQLNSYQVQIKEFTKRIKDNPEWEFAGMYSDEGITGTSMKKRIGMQNMLEAARNGKIDMIITKSISRFARNTVDMLTVIKEMREINVEIYFEKENISSADPKIDFILTIMSSIAQEESRNISENTKWGFRKRFADGQLMMTTTYFLGYDKNDEGELIINKKQAKTVQYIFNQYLNGMGITSLARHLKTQGYKNERGVVTWYPDTVKEILRNEKYVGDLMLQKTVTIDYLSHKTVSNDGHATKYYIKDNHEAIIDRETFDIVQTMIHARDIILSNDNKERYKHLAHKPIKGLVYCSRCKRMYNSKMHNSGTTFKKRMLKCHTDRNNPHNCDNPSIHEPLVEQATLHLIKKLTKTEDMQQALLAFMEKSLEQINSHEPLKQLKEKSVDLANELKKHVRNKIRSGMSDEEYDSIYSKIEGELEQCEIDIINLRNEINRELLTRRRLYALKSFIDSNYEDKRIIKSFFGMILVMGKNHLRYVIDNIFSIIDDLHDNIEVLITMKPFLVGQYYDDTTKTKLTYEVITYEGY